METTPRCIDGREGQTVRFDRFITRGMTALVDGLALAPDERDVASSLLVHSPRSALVILAHWLTPHTLDTV
ncbi:hypothetical protein [Rhizobium sp.]|uniref:hypothetical protein n=1 Tax=Rhizobium sp. TaxID=391 RepID=UPI00289DB4F2